MDEYFPERRPNCIIDTLFVNFFKLEGVVYEKLNFLIELKPSYLITVRF